MKVLAVAALATVSLSSRAASADEVASTWNTENDGTWTYAPAWSTNPNYPDNTMGTTYDAVLGGIGGNQYQVTLDSDIIINSLSISSDDAILDQVDGTFQAGTINLSAGSYMMEAGTLSNSTLNLSGDGTFLAENYSGGTLSNVTLNNGTLTTGGGGVTTLNDVSITGGGLVTGPESVVYQQGTLTISSTGIYLGGDAQFCFDGQSQTIDNYTFYSLQSGDNTIFVGGPTTTGSISLTLGSHVTVLDGNSITNFTPGDGSGLINNGLINADNSVCSRIAITTDNFTNNTLAEATNGGYLQVGSSYNANGNFTNWVNCGTLSAGAGGSTLDLEGNWRNLGTIVAADSDEVIVLGGSFATADIGTLNANGSMVCISGNVNNANATLSIPAFGGVTELYGGAISGGTLDVGSGNLPVISGTVDNLHVTNGGLEVQGSLEILDQLSIDNKSLVMDSGSKLYFSSPVQTVDNLNIQTSGYAYLYAAIPYDYTDAVSLTLGKGVTVHDGAQIEGTSGSTVTNQGAFLADNSASTQYTAPGIVIDVTNFNNSGLLEASNGGMLNIGTTSYSGVVSTVNFTNSGVLLVNNGTIASTSTLSLGTGVLGGTGTISAGLTVASGSTISAGSRAALGTGTADSIGSISTGTQSWAGGGKYFWKIQSLGTGNVLSGTGASGNLGGGAGTEGKSWDQLAMTSLSIAAGGNSPSFTVALASITALSTSSNQYSWVIAQTGSTSLPTFSGATQAYAAGQNLLQYSPTGSGNNAFVLDTSNFAINGVAAPPASSFSLEFAEVGGSSDYDLVLDENVSAAPEPSAALLLAAGIPFFLGRRRKNLSHA